jgi:hypothetical protein
VDVQAAVTRRIQHRLRQDQPIGDDNADIGPSAANSACASAISG